MPSSYAEALDWIYKFSDMERGAGMHRRSPFKFGIQRTEALLRRLGNPHKRLACVQVAGSKGKAAYALWLLAPQSRQACE